MTYNYSYSSNFTNGFNSDQLHSEIKNSIITNSNTNFDGINKNDDIVSIIFINQLNINDLIILNTIIANHQPTPNIGNKIYNLSITEKNITSQIYYIIATIVYPGSNIWPNITNIRGVSYMEANGTNYFIRIYDTTNNKVICEKNLSNTNELINDFGTLSDISTTNAIWEIQCKVVGNTTVNINNIHIYYN